MPGEPHERERRPRRDLERAARPGPAPARSTPSSSMMPSPSRSATGSSRSSRNSVPCSPVSTMRRRCRSPASSTHPVDRDRGVPVARPADRPAALHGPRLRVRTIMARQDSSGDDHVEAYHPQGQIFSRRRGQCLRARQHRDLQDHRRRHRRHLRDFRRALQARLRVAAAHAHQVVPGLLRGRRLRRIPARRRGVPRQEGRLRQHPARHAAQGRLQGRHAHADGVLARPASRA